MFEQLGVLNSHRLIHIGFKIKMTNTVQSDVLHNTIEVPLVFSERSQYFNQPIVLNALS